MMAGIHMLVMFIYEDKTATCKQGSAQVDESKVSFSVGTLDREFYPGAQLFILRFIFLFWVDS